MNGQLDVVGAKNNDNCVKLHLMGIVWWWYNYGEIPLYGYKEAAMVTGQQVK